jgi:hypothetical protein
MMFSIIVTYTKRHACGNVQQKHSDAEVYVENDKERAML